MLKAGMNKKRNHARWAIWQKRIEAWQASGLMQSEFCREQGIAPRHFSLWKRKLETTQTDTIENGFVEIPASTTKLSTAALETTLRINIGKFVVNVGSNEIVITPVG